MAEIEVVGIRDLDAVAIHAAQAAGKIYKLVTRIERAANGVVASVKPEQLEMHDPLAMAGEAALLAHFELDVIPGLTMTLHVPTTGTAGPDVTAYDVLADFIRAVKH